VYFGIGGSLPVPSYRIYRDADDLLCMAMLMTDFGDADGSLKGFDTQ
jgi:hypothetical protein